MTATVPPCPNPFNMAEYILQAGMRVPEKKALEVLGGQSLSYGELRTTVAGFAGGLKALGFVAGDKVLFRLGNRVEFPIAYLACIWAGLIPVPSSAALKSAEITKIARALSPDVILAEPGVDLPDVAAPVLDISALNRADPCAPDMGDPNRLAYILFTSGTSGEPRGVCHAHRAIWARRMMFDGWYGLGPDDRMLHAGAFNWSYTMGTGLMDPWTVGATALIPGPNMVTDDLAHALRDAAPSILAAAPGVFRQLLRSPELPVTPTLRHALSAGENLAPALRDRWKAKMGSDIHEALGMTECSTFISGNPAQPAPKGTCGRAQQGRKIAVWSKEGQEVAPDMPGDLMIHRDDPGMMLGYLDDDNALPNWFRTGDTVSISQDGWVRYLGRNDDVITAGGFRVSPLEVEAAMTGHSGIEDCAAVQVRRDAETTLIALFYVAQNTPSEAELRAHAQSLLASYKQPHLYIGLSALPKGANGKLNRRILRDEFEASQ